MGCNAIFFSFFMVFDLVISAAAGLDEALDEDRAHDVGKGVWYDGDGDPGIARDHILIIQQPLGDVSVV